MIHTLKKFMGISLLLIFSSCAISPPDVPAFLPFDENRAYYVYTISNREGWVDNDTNLFVDPELAPVPLKWNDVKKHAFIVPSFTWERINTFISQMCEKEKKKCKEAGRPDLKTVKVKQVIQMRTDAIEKGEINDTN